MPSEQIERLVEATRACHCEVSLQRRALDKDEITEDDLGLSMKYVNEAVNAADEIA